MLFSNVEPETIKNRKLRFRVNKIHIFNNHSKILGTPNFLIPVSFCHFPLGEQCYVKSIKSPDITENKIFLPKVQYGPASSHLKVRYLKIKKNKTLKSLSKKSNIKHFYFLQNHNTFIFWGGFIGKKFDKTGWSIFKVCTLTQGT